jgi:endo-1,4-beta-xylanase
MGVNAGWGWGWAAESLGWDWERFPSGLSRGRKGVIVAGMRCRLGCRETVIFALGLACTRPAAEGPAEVPGAAAPAAEVAGPSLAQKYADQFLIGAAVDTGGLQTHAPLLAQHFNSLTAENEMKFESIEPTEGAFDYRAGDQLVAFAREHGMKMRGHTLVWHRQTPDWVFVDAAGAPASRELLLARLKKHIDNVVGHYKGSLYAWDVVNEAILDNGKVRTNQEAEPDQRTRWHGILGVDYIAEAFRYAHAADPDAKLFYNDYRLYVPEKRQGVYEMLKGMLASGVPVHGVGIQAHLAIAPSADAQNHGFHQTVEQEEAAIELFASLGLDVQITELDLSVYVPGVKYTPDQFYTLETFTDEVKAKQAERYAAFFQLFRKHADVISGVTFWGVADDNTWLSEFASGRKDFPLLFDVNHAPKPAFERVMAL